MSRSTRSCIVRGDLPIGWWAFPNPHLLASGGGTYRQAEQEQNICLPGLRFDHPSLSRLNPL